MSDTVWALPSELAIPLLNGDIDVLVYKRRIRQIDEGDRLLVYVGGMYNAVLGQVTVTKQTVEPADAIWDKHAEATGLTERQFRLRCGEVQRAFSMLVTDPIAYAQPIPLPEGMHVVTTYIRIDQRHPVHRVLLRKADRAAE
jgi:predicted transcriptional regulator